MTIRRRGLKALRLGAQAAALVAVTLLLAGALAAWRLTLGPVDASMLAPAVERAAADGLRRGTGHSVGVHMDALVLVWDEADRAPALRAAGVALTPAEGGEPARFVAVNLRFKLSALIRGRFVLAGVELIEPELELGRDPGGADPAGLTGLLARLAGDDDPGGDPGADPLAGLSRLSIRDGRLAIVDATTGQRLEAAGTLTLARDNQGVTADFHLSIAAGAGAPAVPLAGAARLARQGDDLAWELTFSGLVPAAVAPLLGDGGAAAAAAAAVAAPVDAIVRGIASADGVVRQVEADLTLGAGTIQVPALPPAPLPVRGGRLRGGWQAAAGQARIESLALNLGTADEAGPVLTGRGDATLTPEATRIDATVGLDALAMASLGPWWPEGVADAARAWVTGHITAGSVDGATADLGVSISGDGAVTVERLSGEFGFQDLTVHLRQPAAPVTGLSGRGRFDRDSLRLTAAAGQLGGLAVGDVSVALTGLAGAAPRVRIDNTVAGPLEAALALLADPALGLGIDGLPAPGKLAGGLTETGWVEFPLAAGLTLAQVEMQRQATVTAVTWRDIVPGVTLSGGPLAIGIDRQRLHFSGPAQINGVPVDLSGQHRFVAAAADDVQLEVTAARLDEAGRAAFGLDAAPWLTGPVALTIALDGDPRDRGTARLRAGLDAATLAIAPLGWSKPAGSPGAATALVRFGSDGGVVIEDLDLAAGGLVIRGAVSLGPDRRLRHLALARLAVGAIVLDDVRMSAADDGHLDITLAGGEIDARPWLTSAGGAAGRGDLPDRLSLTASRLRRIDLGDGRELRDVDATLVRDGGQWQSIRLAGRASAGPGIDGERRAGSSAFTFRFGPRPAGGGATPLRLDAESAGDLLYTFAAVEDLVGGRLRVDGEATGGDLASPLRLAVEMDSFAYGNRAPTRRALQAAGSLLSERDRIEVNRFDRLRGEGVVHAGQVRIDSVAASNDSLGLSAQGSIDLNRGTVAMTGAVVPVRQLNRLLGAIPLVGKLFSPGEGLIAIEVTVRGPLADPAIETHPLRSLTPAFLTPLRQLLPLPGGR